jgi:hypothetical protein
MLRPNIAVAAIFAASITAPTAHADCGDPGQDPCTGPVPTVDQVVAILAELTDPNKPAVDKTNIVTPGFGPDEAGTIDDHLTRPTAFHYLPYDFVVTDIEPAPANQAGATVVTTGGYRHRTGPAPVVLINQNGRWLITHDTAVTELDRLWQATQRVIYAK